MNPAKGIPGGVTAFRLFTEQGCLIAGNIFCVSLYDTPLAL